MKDIHDFHCIVFNTREGKEYTLEIKNIAMEDAAKYACKCNDITTVATLTVEERKYNYYFNQKLPKTAEVVRGKDLTLECSVSDPRAPVSWYHKGNKLEVTYNLIYTFNDYT